MNVFEASNARLKTVFEDFDNVYVSFSGGKDSGILLNLCIDYLRKHHPGRRLGVFHIDYEAQYQMTTDYVDPRRCVDGALYRHASITNQGKLNDISST